MNLVPAVMIKNEEGFIETILRPLHDVFDRVLVADTGSTDRTVEIVQSFPKVDLKLHGAQSPKGLTGVRNDLHLRARTLGYSHVLLVDGDELYSRKALELIAKYQLPYPAVTAFTLMLSVDYHDSRFWEMDDLFNRQAIMPVEDVFSGDYPFEIPTSFARGIREKDLRPPENGFWYLELPEGLRYHAVHLHRLTRSPKDGEVVYRLKKQFQFSMVERNIPRTIPFDLTAWSNS